MNAYYKPHPEGFKAYLGKDEATGLYKIRVGWTVYLTNAKLNVLYTLYWEKKTPVDVELFMVQRPKVYEALVSEVQFQRKKQLAIDLQNSHISSSDRKAYKHRRGFTGSR